MTYEEFKQLAEHPQHRDVPAIFKLEVLETEELEEKKRSHFLYFPEKGCHLGTNRSDNET